MPHRNQLATPKVKDIERSLDITRPFMDDIGESSDQRNARALRKRMVWRTGWPEIKAVVFRLGYGRRLGPRIGIDLRRRRPRALEQPPGPCSEGRSRVLSRQPDAEGGEELADVRVRDTDGHDSERSIRTVWKNTRTGTRLSGARQPAHRISSQRIARETPPVSPGSRSEPRRTPAGR